MKTTTLEPVADLESVHQAARAVALLDPLRQRIMRELREPASASEVAGRLGETRQKVNYHVRKLASAKVLKKAGRRTKRNMIEQRWVATARAYLLAPDVLQPIQPDPAAVADQRSAEYLLALSGLLQSELGTARHEADAKGQRLSTLGLDGELRFESAAQRARFARALEQAVAEVVRKHASPGEHGAGRPFRLVVGCYPIPSRGQQSRHPVEEKTNE